MFRDSVLKMSYLREVCGFGEITSKVWGRRVITGRVHLIIVANTKDFPDNVKCLLVRCININQFSDFLGERKVIWIFRGIVFCKFC